MAKSLAAVGIPDRSDYVDPPKVTDPKIWKFTLHDHEARRAGCFLPSTRVLMASGEYERIDSIKKDDLVWTFVGPKRVIRVWDNGPVDEWLEVAYGDDKVVCTSNHPFWVEGRGWVAIGDLYAQKDELSDSGWGVPTLRRGVQRKINPEVLHPGVPAESQPQEICRASCGRKDLHSLRGEVHGQGQESSDLQLPVRGEAKSLEERTSTDNNQRGWKAASEPKSYSSVAEVTRGKVPTSKRQGLAEERVSREEKILGGDSRFGRLLQDVGNLSLQATRYPFTGPEGGSRSGSCQERGEEQPWLEGWSIQRTSCGLVRIEPSKVQVSEEADRGARRALREVREWPRVRQEDRSAPHSSVDPQQGQLVGERCATVHEVPWRGGESLRGDGSKALRISRLPRAQRARFDLEIEDAHHYVAEGFLVHNSHYDLRLGDPSTGLTFNWAGKKWPRPGEGTYVISQPLHDYDYLNFKGEIKDGYGAGRVDIARREPTEIVSSNPERVQFNLYKGRTPEQFVLRKVDGKKWVLRNTTPSRDIPRWNELVPPTKPSYREKGVGWLDFAKNDEVLQAKIDGAHNYYVFRAGQPMRVFSYRKARSTPTGLIEHTFKIPGWEKNVVPKELDNTVMRGEVYAVDRRGKALKEKDVGALLNTSTLESRAKQQRTGHLQTSVFNVEKFRGKDVSKLPYEIKLKLMEQAAEKIPGLHLPPTARTPQEKQMLFQKIQRGQEKLTREGVVSHNLRTDQTHKVKFRPDFDVYIRQVNPSTHPGWAGSVSYSLTPRGPIVGTMGSGFTHAQRERMLENPGDYVGRVARVKAEGQFDSGALRVPVFKDWHQEKSEEKLFKEGRIRKKDGMFEVLSKDNKVLGRHIRQDLARRQERAIHARRGKTASILAR